MQTLYAFHQCKQSNYQIALDSISEGLTQELYDLPEGHNVSENEGKIQMGKILFKEHYNTNIAVPDEENKDAVFAATKAVTLYKNQIKKDYDFFSRNMVAEVEKIEVVYLQMFTLMIELAEQSEKDKRGALKSTLLQNKVIRRLIDSAILNQAAAKKNAYWSKNHGEIKNWYIDIVKKDEKVLVYLNQAEHTFEEDKEIVNHIFRQIILKEKTLISFFEEKEIAWAEDKIILKSMITNTLNSVNEEKDIEITSLSENWEDDLEFFTVLFRNTVQNNDEYRALISEKAKNWDVERIALTDRVILKMAIAEMITFTSIPVKVTINEYIEISKLYSTPKSRKFINGLLDSISEDLQKSGKIRKSGRGLIDNK